MATSVSIAERIETVRVRNTRAADLPFYLEPWGEHYVLAPGAALEIVAEGPSGDSLEVELSDDHLTVYGWSGSTVTLYQEGKELGAGNEARSRVPSIPQCEGE